MNNRLIKQFTKDRDAAIESMDLDKFKAFYKKYKALGIYRMHLPSDEVIEASMRKMALASRGVSKKNKERS